MVRVRPGRLAPFELTVPGDPSQAAFWVVAGCVVKDSEIRIPGIYTGKARRGFLDILRRMGADIEELEPQDPGADVLGSTSDLVVKETGRLSATEVDASEITGLDEVPVLAVAAAIAKGTTLFRGMSELRVKESDRLSGISGWSRPSGPRQRSDGDDLLVTGSRISDRRWSSHGETIGWQWLAAVAAMAAAGTGTTVIKGWNCVGTSYKDFAEDVAASGERRS